MMPTATPMLPIPPDYNNTNTNTSKISNTSHRTNKNKKNKKHTKATNTPRSLTKKAVPLFHFGNVAYTGDTNNYYVKNTIKKHLVLPPGN